MKSNQDNFDALFKERQNHSTDEKNVYCEQVIIQSVKKVTSNSMKRTKLNKKLCFYEFQCHSFGAFTVY